MYIRSFAEQSTLIEIRPINKSDYQAWLPLWEGYNAFYGRQGLTALDPNITKSTWSRFFNDSEPVNAFVAELEDNVVGFVHFIYHRNTIHINDVCYLQDLYVGENARNSGIGKHLIEAVYQAAKKAGSKRVYWNTQITNAAGRALYDKVAKHNGFILYSTDW